MFILVQLPCGQLVSFPIHPFLHAVLLSATTVIEIMTEDDDSDQDGNTYSNHNSSLCLSPLTSFGFPEIAAAFLAALDLNIQVLCKIDSTHDYEL
jgi:hypothetical protein